MARLRRKGRRSRRASTAREGPPRCCTFVVRRIAATVPVLVIVALIVFLMLRLAPGDPAAAILGDHASSDAIRSVRAGLGLEQSIPVQFFQWSAAPARPATWASPISSSRASPA